MLVPLYDIFYRSAQELVEEARNIAAGLSTQHRSKNSKKQQKKTEQLQEKKPPVRTVDEIISSLKTKTEDGELYVGNCF